MIFMGVWGPECGSKKDWDTFQEMQNTPMVM